MKNICNDIADDLIEPRRGGENTGRRWSEATLGDEGDAFVATRRKNPC